MTIETSHAERARVDAAGPAVAPTRQRGATHPALTMQRAAGNAAVTRVVQHHLRQPARGDEGEEQARRAADAAVGGPPSIAVRAPPAPIGADIAMRSVGAGGGMPLDGRTRTSMESQFGHDFADVRVHTGGEAATTAAAVDAVAFTVGRDVVFAQGRYRPDSAAGTKLIAHELAHVVQQARTGPELARQTYTSADPLGLWSYAEPPVPTIDPLSLLDPGAVVVSGGEFGATPDDPLSAYPTVAAALPADGYERLRTAARTRTAAQRAAGVGAATARSPQERRPQHPGPVPRALTSIPVASLAGLDAQYLDASFANALVPYLLMPEPPSRQIALVMRNEVVRRMMTRYFPATSVADISLVDPGGHEPGRARLTFTFNGHAVDLAADGFFHLDQLNEAAGRPLDGLRSDVVRDAEQVADYATLVVRARRAIDRAPGLASGVTASPEDYSLASVRGFRDDLVSLRQDISAFTSDLVTQTQIAELFRLSERLLPLIEPINRAVTRVDQLHAATATGITVDEGTEYFQRLGREGAEDAGEGLLADFRRGFWGMSAGEHQLQHLVPGTGAMDAATLAYRRGDISLSSFHSIMLHQAIRMEIGMVVMLAAGMLGSLLGGAAGVALFGAETLGASVTAGGVGGLFAGVGQLGGEDIYGATVAAVSTDPALAASMRSTIHTGGEYVFAGGTGMFLGGLMGAAEFTPRLPQQPVIILDAAGRPQLVSGGQVVPRPAATAPVTLWTSESSSVQVQGGRVLPQATSTGPVRLFGPNEGQSVLVQGGQVVDPAATTLAGGSRLVTPQGQPIGGGMRQPLPGLVDPLGNPIGGGGGPVIVDLQSGQASFLRDVTARVPGSTGIGVESGDWLLGYQGVHPTNPADLAMARMLARSGPVWPDAPAWRTPFGQIPRALPWEMDPGRAFWPQSGSFRVLPEPFFPPVGGEGRLVPRGFGDITAIEPTTHPQLRGIADQVYLRRPFGLGRADPGVTSALGRELNDMLRARGFVELRLTRQGEFSVPTAGNTGLDQLSIVASQIEGASIERVDAAAIRAFARGQTRGLSPVQLEMLQNAAADLGGAGALGQGDIVRIIRIYKGVAAQSASVVGAGTTVR